MITELQGAQSSGLAPIIMVDDSDVDFHIAELMYKKSDLQNPFIHCNSGPALLDYLEQHKSEGGLPASLILMDINMPGMNGIEAVEAIRSKPGYREVPIIAMLTSSFDSSDRQRAEQVGANDYINKPMNPAEYITIFNNLAAISASGAGSNS